MKTLEEVQFEQIGRLHGMLSAREVENVLRPLWPNRRPLASP